jgi:serine protease Do
MRERRTLAAVAIVATAMAACSQPASSPAGSVKQATVTPTAPASPSAATAGLLVDSIDALPGAVLQIETTGTFRDPFDGSQFGVGAGSGFIIDPSGIALTNNHVVTGADTVTAYVGANRAEHPAEVLGVSECSDLAVIRIKGGERFPYLDWYEGDIKPGLEIYVAGFPLGDPEFTLTRGIVSRAHGVIDEYWASVDDSIEHDANTNPGNSGGPVVTDDAQVVAIHYAGNEETRQSFAISRDEALRVLPQLEADRDVAAFGVNGQAIAPDAGLSVTQGIWVSSVEPDSVADEAGILPGDTIVKLDGAKMAVTGTMKEYCDVLRAHQQGDAVPITVYREDSRETLSAELNGVPLKPGFSFSTELGNGPPEDPTALEFGHAMSESGALSFESPDSWQDELEQAWSFGGAEVGPGLIESTDVSAFKGGWRTPGVYVAASSSIGRTVDEILDADRSRFEKSCEHGGRASFVRGGYAGKYDLWTGCDGSDAKFLTIAASPNDGSHVVYVQFQGVSDDDLAVLDRILATLEVDLSGS